ncbi:MAG: hypothetical protein ACI4TF_13750 [Oliverpabstia sp.]
MGNLDIERTSSGLSRKGTYQYMAPEVYRGEPYGFAADIYALGLVLYRLLNQYRLPFCPLPPEKLTYSVNEESLARRMAGEPVALPCCATEQLGRIILKAVAFHPADRYADPSEMRKELEEVLRSDSDRSLASVVDNSVVQNRTDTRRETLDLERTVHLELEDRYPDNIGENTREKDFHKNQQADSLYKVNSACEDYHYEQVRKNKKTGNKKKRIGLVLAITAVFILTITLVCLLLILRNSNKEDSLADSENDAVTVENDNVLENEALIAACAHYEQKNYTAAESEFREIIETSEDTEVGEKAFRMLAQLYSDCAEMEMVSSEKQFEKSAVLMEIELIQQGIVRYQLYYDSSLYEMLGLAGYQAYQAGHADNYEYLDVAREAFEKVLTLGVKKEYIYTNLYTIQYIQNNLTEAEIIICEMEEAFADSYLPHALMAMLYITAGNEDDAGIDFRFSQGLTKEECYLKAQYEYEKAGELLKTSDDTTYYLQLQTYIQELKENGWLD